jgi:hypothetical protein
MDILCWQLGGASSETFVACTSLNDYFTFSPPLFKWCLSLKTFILFFPHEAPSFSLESSLRASKGLCLCYEGPCPSRANFSLLNNHYCFTSSSSSRFVLALFKFFDGVQARGKFGFFFLTCSGRHSSIQLTFQLDGLQTWYSSTFKMYLTHRI